jgi:hypothetical protein
VVERSLSARRKPKPRVYLLLGITIHVLSN